MKTPASQVASKSIHKTTAEGGLHPVDPLTKRVVTLTVLEPAEEADDAKLKQQQGSPHQHSHDCGMTVLRRNENVTSSTSSFPGAFSVEGPHAHHHLLSASSTGTSTDEEEEDDEEVDGEVASSSSSSSSVANGSQEGDVENQQSQEVVVTAAEITQDQVERMEQEIRNRILQESVVADQVVPVSVLLPAVPDKQDLPETSYRRQDSSSLREKRRLILIVVIVLLALVAVALAFGLTQKAHQPQNEEEDAEPSTIDTSTIRPSSTSLSTLQAIQQRGYIRCGLLFYMPGFAMPSQDAQHEPAKWEGINVDQCKALSVAIFGNPHQYEMVELNSTRAQSLAFVANQTVDVLTDTLMATMDRDRLGGYAFSTPYVYSQSKFAGVPDYVDCADHSDSFNGVCRQVKVCVSAGSIQEGILTNLLPGSALVPFHSKADWIQKWNNGDCNVILANTAFTTKTIMRSFGYQGPYATGTKVFASGPLVLVTREQDYQWSNLVNLMVQTFFWAEANNISKGTPQGQILSEHFNSTIDSNNNGLVDPQVTHLMANMISQVGNYGETYQQNLQAVIPREGLNLLDSPSNGTSGLLYTFPFGSLDEAGPDPNPNGTLRNILNQGFLRCGIHPQLGFATQNKDGSWEGMDIDVCQAVSAAIFQGQTDKVHFVNLAQAESSFVALNTSQVDLVAGARVTIQAGYREPTTGVGHSFSRPYYYFGANLNQTTHSAHALMTRQDDHEWSDFCFWIVNCLFYAQEQGIHQTTSIDMPVVSLYGEGLKQMFRDAVSAVGSYQEAYQRNLEALTPRAESRNILNAGLSGPQHYAIPLVV